jgi:pyruvate dehydrogenase E2 component (dihydrolipoamide acetyltransferase)
VAQEIRIPDIGGDVEAVEVVEVLVAAGDTVGVDDPVIVIESDKASMDVPAGVAGVIERIEVSVGDQVSEGQVIARLKETQAAEPAAGSGEAQSSPKGRKSGRSKAEPQPNEAVGEGSPAGKSAGAQRTVEVRVPDIGEAENVEVIEVAVKAGDRIAANDVLVVVESDKASMDIPSPHAGTIVEVHVGEGTEVAEGTLLVTLETSDAGSSGEGPASEAIESSEPVEPVEPVRVDEPVDKPVAERRETGAPASRAARPDAAPARPETRPSGGEVYAGPAVRRLARELGADLSAVQGSGHRGRIVKDDVKAHVKERLSSGAAAAAGNGGLPPLPVIDFSRFGEVEERPLSRIRARGADNLHRSWVNIPHVTQHDDVDVTDLEDFRAGLRDEGETRGIRITPLAFIIKACCQALKEYPTINASLDPAAKTFYLKHYYHVGVAVDTDDGLVVPVIRNADQKGIWELSGEVAELAEKARNRKLGVSDMQGGSFSVTSLGAIGGTGFTPIINGPEVAILGVGRLAIRPHWDGTQFVPRKMLPLSLSYDHRAINGAEAGRFVARLGQLLGDIRLLAL